ncbi:ABC transporter permease [Brevibacillus agri]|uniref:ABC transporter permease n=1 Tax=Brevibacillus agri TaxID=51101 RepID=UPI0018CED3CF|nr:ABC transporter permease [Brevibacillus agri]
MNKVFKRLGKLLVILAVVGNNFSILAEPANASTSNPDIRGRKVGYLDANKKVQDSYENYIDGWSFGGEAFNLTLADVKWSGAVSGGGSSYKVANYSKATETSNNGYPIVDISEAQAYARLFNGNPSFLTNENGFYGGKISGGGGQPYTGYLLSKVAEMSGGGGGPFSFRPASGSEKGSYIGVTNFVTTPRPDGSITTDKTKYDVGSTVTITAKGKDYSIYNRGLIVYNMYVYNLDTGQTEQKFTDALKTYDIPGAAPTDGSGTGYEVKFPVKTWTPTKPGNYEARILFTDTHGRNTKNAPSVDGQGVAYSARFTVGAPTTPPPDPEEPDPTPSCSIETTKMDIQVVGDRDIKNHTAVSSGGSDIVVEKYAEITVFAKKNGTFTMNGSPMATGSGGNKKVGIGSIGSSGRVKVVYKSDDGTECWEKYFRVESKDGEDKCPIITLNNSVIRNGQTIEILPIDKLYFKAKYTDKNGETGPAEIMWDVTRPNGSVVTLPGQYDDKDKWHPYNSDKLSLPTPPEVVFEKGKTYKLKLNYATSQWNDRPECNFEITIVVKDASCSIAEQRKVVFFVHGQYPNPFSPEGDSLDSSPNGPSTLTQPVYMRYFTDAGDHYETNMGFSTKLSGRWYLKWNGQKIPLTDGVVPALEKFDLQLPTDVDVGDTILISFESETGCVGELTFTILSDRKCPDILASVETKSNSEKWSKNIKRGETIELAADELQGKYWFRMFLSQDSSYMLKWFDPSTGMWERKRDGKYLSSSGKPGEDHWLLFPTGDDDLLLDGLYKVELASYEDENCGGSFFIQIGEVEVNGENLLIVKSSFSITPKDPQEAGTSATITFNVKNEGKTEHDTKLAVRWASSPTATILDVKGFKPGEVRKITVPTYYPQNSENFIANINPDKDKPSDESKWPDNRAEWPVRVTGRGEPPSSGGSPSPGGPIDGGQLKIKVYDSGNRLLNLPNDGVWEKEKARIEVEIDQTKIRQALGQVNAAVNEAINVKISELLETYSGETFKGVSVKASPTYWDSVDNPMTNWPSSTNMTVNGPGVNASYFLNTKQQIQSNFYAGTTVPTKKDGQDILQTKYVVTAEGFQIVASYKVEFQVTFEECDEDGENCSSGSDSDQISNTFTINIKGDKTQFEVYDLWVKGYVKHTDRWDALRKAYNTQKTGNPESPRTYDVFWGGEKFILYADSTNTGTSPVKGATLKVTMSTTNVTSDLKSTDKTTWNGDMWRENFDKLRNGTYTFTFVLTYNHTGPDGQYHVETDTVHIRILNPVWEVVKTNRIH